MKIEHLMFMLLLLSSFINANKEGDNVTFHVTH